MVNRGRGMVHRNRGLIYWSWFMVDWCHVAWCLVVSWFSVRSSVGKVIFFFVNAALWKNKIGNDEI